MVVTRKLRRDGVRYNKLRWNSNAFQGLRNRIGINADVLIRIDPVDIRNAYAFDEDTEDWLKGDLVAETEAEKLTLSQYEHLRKKIDNEHVFDDVRALTMAQAAQDIRDFVDSRKKNAGIVPKPIARFVTDGRKAAEHIHQERWDPDESTTPLGSHDIDADAPKARPPDARGPWREQVIKAVAASPVNPTNPKSARETPARVSESSAGPVLESPCRNSPLVFPGRRRGQ